MWRKSQGGFENEKKNLLQRRHCKDSNLFKLTPFNIRDLAQEKKRFMERGGFSLSYHHDLDWRHSHIYYGFQINHLQPLWEAKEGSAEVCVRCSMIVHYPPIKAFLSTKKAAKGWIWWGRGVSSGRGDGGACWDIHNITIYQCCIYCKRNAEIDCKTWEEEVLKIYKKKELFNFEKIFFISQRSIFLRFLFKKKGEGLDFIYHRPDW